MVLLHSLPGQLPGAGSHFRRVSKESHKKNIKYEGIRKTSPFKLHQNGGSKVSVDNSISEQTGGYKAFKPPYRREKNVPFVSNEEKIIHKKRIAEKPK